MQKIKLYLPGDTCPRCDNRLIADGLELDEVFCLSGHRYLSPHRTRDLIKMRIEEPDAVESHPQREAREPQPVLEFATRLRRPRTTYAPTVDTDERERSSKLALELLAAS